MHSNSIEQRNIIGAYTGTLGRMIRKPSVFFMEYADQSMGKQPIIFLLMSSLLFTAACLLSRRCENLLLPGSVLFLNAFSMVWISAMIGYCLVHLFPGKKIRFFQFFSIYALSSSVTLMVSWIPAFLFPAEIWKWWLIGTGLTKMAELRVYQAVITVGLSVLIITLLVFSATRI